MAHAVRRTVLKGTMAMGGGKRRAYLFRIDPTGLVAIRIGNPLSWTSFFVIVFVFFELLGRTALGWGSLIAGAAVGMVVLGILDRGIARAVASQPRDRILKSAMNVFLPKEAWKDARIEDGARYTFVELRHGSVSARIAIQDPRPPAAREILQPLRVNA